MWEVIKYNKARQLIESRFKGLPHAHSTLIKSIISLADPSTGIVKNTSYNELSLILAINPAPGRKDSGTPSKQTIRNYIKSIEKECGQYFKVISEGQSLKFLFPELPKIFSELFESREINTEVKPSETVAYTEQNNYSDAQDDTEANIELNTPINAVKNIIFNNINNNNNNKHGICSNFTPNAETISRANILGYSNVEDPTEIQSFIEYNTACGAQWADFNPIYLRWLAKSRERQQQKNQMKNTRSFNHENQHRNKTKTNTSSVRERVIQAYASEFTFCEETRRFDSKAEQEQRIYCDFVAAIN